METHIYGCRMSSNIKVFSTNVTLLSTGTQQVSISSTQTHTDIENNPTHFSPPEPEADVSHELKVLLWILIVTGIIGFILFVVMLSLLFYVSKYSNKSIDSNI